MLDQLFTKTVNSPEASQNVIGEMMETADDAYGFSHALGPDHHVFFQEPEENLFNTQKAILLVSFVEHHQDELFLEEVCPTSCEMRERNGWSQMTVVNRKDGWFQAKEIYDFFTKLEKMEFFDDFDQVIFTGTLAAAYAAAVHSVSAPGATVLLFSPIATADGEQAPWDPRLTNLPDVGHKLRYGPDMIEAALDVYVFYDPFVALDAKHADLFDQDFVQKFRCRFMGKDTAFGLSQTDAYSRIIETVGRDALDLKTFGRIYRTRHRDRRYLRRLVSATCARETAVFKGVAARAALTKFDARFFRRTLRQAMFELELQNTALPAPLGDRQKPIQAVAA